MSDKKKKPALSAKQAEAAASKGRAALGHGDVAAAIDELERAAGVLAEPELIADLADARFRAGTAELESGTLAGAHAHLTRAHALAPARADVARALARACWMTGDLDGASRALSALGSRAPAPALTLGLALIRVRQRALEPAAGLVERARRELASGDDSGELARTAELIALLGVASHESADAVRAAGSKEGLIATSRELAVSVTRDHQAAAAWFIGEARAPLERALLAARREMADVLAAPPGTPVPDPVERLVPALTAALEPSVRELAERAGSRLREVKTALAEPWPAATARVLAALLYDGDGDAALAALGEVPEGAPLGLFLVLEIAGELAAGRAATAMSRLSDPAAGALPPRVVLALVETAIDRLDPEAPLELFQALARLGGQLSGAHRARLADALFARGDAAGALGLWRSLTAPDDRQRRGMALAAEWLGIEDEAVAPWHAVVRRHLDTPPGTPVPEWLPAAVVHLADLHRGRGDADAITDLLRRGASRLAGEPSVLEAWIEHLEEHKMERDLERAADSARRLAAARPDQKRLHARALTAAGRHADAFRVLAELVATPGDAAVEALFERVARDRANKAKDARTALAALDEARAVRPPTPWLLYVEAAVRDAVERGSGSAVRARAYDDAKADPESAVRIALDVMKNRSAADGLALLRELPSIAELPVRQAAEVTAGFLALDESETGARWIDDRLARAADDLDRIAFLALVAVSLVDAHKRPDLARELGARAAPLEAAEPKVKDAVVNLAAPSPDGTPRSFELSVHRLERLRRLRDTLDRKRPWMRAPPWVGRDGVFALDATSPPPPATKEALAALVREAIAQLAAGRLGLL